MTKKEEVKYMVAVESLNRLVIVRDGRSTIYPPLEEQALPFREAQELAEQLRRSGMGVSQVGVEPEWKFQHPEVVGSTQASL